MTHPEITAFSHWLESRGLRITSQRALIARVLFDETDAHLTSRELVDRCRAQEPSIGAVTVHRTLALLVESGLVDRHRLLDRSTVYEAAGHHHDHLVCDACGRVIEVEDDALERRQEVVAKQLGFRMVGHRHVLVGACLDADCVHRPSE
ncbi:MAG: transcriptional repressor [Myxococcales bacterium]|nr:transcriptional repressor [Myxococcales bacterium]